MAGGPAYLRSGGSSNKIFYTGDLGINGIKGGPWFIRIRALSFATWFYLFALYYMTMIYLTNVWNLSITHAAAIINIFDGISEALVIVFGFFVDAFLGDFYMLVLSSIASCIGLGLLSLSTPTFFGPCSEYKEECIGHIQKVLFFTSLSCMAVGRACFEVSFDSFEDRQSEAAEVPAPAEATEVPAPAEAAEAPAPAEATEACAPAEAPAPAEAAEATAAPAPSEDAEAPTPVEAEDNGISVFLIFMLGIIGGCIALPYIKPWSILFGIPAICFLAATVLFLTGYQLYKYSKPEGSPLTIGLRVFVAAATKDFQQVKGFKAIYNDDYTLSTKSLRWLDKAAIKFPDQGMLKSWTLCTVREVEDTKTGIRKVPLLLTLIGTGLVLSIGNTYFVDQANHMDPRLGSIKIHVTIFLLFYLISLVISPLTYALLKKCISIPKRYDAPNKIALGMVFSILCCITAALVETRRLDNERIPMSVFVLLPQFLLLGAVEGLTESGIESFLRNQVPESMHKYLLHFKSFVIGLGSMVNVLWVYVVGKLSERNNNPNWFQHTSSKSRLDLYYWTLAGLSAVNLVIYAIVASTYKYDDEEDRSMTLDIVS